MTVWMSWAMSGKLENNKRWTDRFYKYVGFIYAVNATHRK